MTEYETKLRSLKSHNFCHLVIIDELFVDELFISAVKRNI